MTFYRLAIRPWRFLADPEWIHDRSPAARLAAMPGAVSGRPCEPTINRTLAELYRRMDRQRFRLIAAGGVFSAEDAYQKIRLGASLVQLMTGMIYEGPALPGKIAEGLSQAGTSLRQGCSSLKPSTSRIF